MAWGEDWLKPIQPRLAKEYPALSRDELDECNTLCQEAMRFGHALVKPRPGTTESEARELWASEMRAAYPWVDEDNLSHLYSQGMYYAMK